MNKHLRLSILAISIAALAACARTPVPDIEAADVPTNWDGPLAENAALWPNVDWWNNFGSPELTAFMEEVKRENLDFQNNLRSLQAAEIQLRQAGFDLWPTPSVSIGTGTTTSTQQLAGGGSAGGGSTQGFNLSASVSSGSLLNKPLNYERALNDYTSRQAQISSTALSTMTLAARTYFTLLAVRDNRRVTELNLMTAQESLRVTQAEVDAGRAVPINALSSAINVQNLENSLLSSYQQEYSTLASLALLVGRGVEGFNLEGQSLADITLPTVQPGLPSELLTRRPDLVQAEVALRNASISVDSARLAFLPQISMNLSGSASSPALINVISDPVTTSVTLGTNLSMALLDNGSRKRNLEQSRLSLETSLASYRTTIIRAFNDINIQLRNIELVQAQGAVIAQQLLQAEEQERLAQLRYDVGSTTYLEWLSAQRDLFSARQSVQNNRQQQLTAILDLYTALGGGWEIGTVLLNDPAYAAAN
jgi:NodT family efflux transporter outer membrane factor (OMF) lipoprotein